MSAATLDSLASFEIGHADLEDGEDDEPSTGGYGPYDVDAEEDNSDYERADYI